MGRAHTLCDADQGLCHYRNLPLFLFPLFPYPRMGTFTLTNVSSRLFEANLRDVLHLAQAICSSPPMFVPT